MWGEHLECPDGVGGFLEKQHGGAIALWLYLTRGAASLGFPASGARGAESAETRNHGHGDAPLWSLRRTGPDVAMTVVGPGKR